MAILVPLPLSPLESLSNIAEGGKSFSTVVPFSAAVSREKRSRSHKFRLFLCKAGKRQEDVLPFPEKGKVFYSRTKRLFPLFCGKSASQSRFIRSAIFPPFCWERKGFSECARKSGKPIYAASFSFFFGREEESAYYISPCQVGRAKFWPLH